MDRAQIMQKLEGCGVRPTPQRLEIAQVILGQPQHLYADQIIDILRENDSSVSKATVYNTLNLFSTRGIVRECVVDPERRFYDSTSTPHHHFYVVDTGELVDIPDDGIGFSHLPEFPDDHELEGVEVVIRVKSRAPENLG
jgi:Fur family iron response transcriptional regulator